MLKKLTALVCAALLPITAFAIDDPALKNPEKRYDEFYEGTDTGEYLLFNALDEANNEAADIAEYGSLRFTENLLLDEQGNPMLKVEGTIFESPYGKVLMNTCELFGVEATTYNLENGTYTLNDGEVSKSPADPSFNFYCENYHFPYGALDALNGVRQDDEGNYYFLIRNRADRSFEFAADNEMRIQQLRIYERNDEGALLLTSFVDYWTEAAPEIPEEIIAAIEADRN